jgi:hypothetical protein
MKLIDILNEYEINSPQRHIPLKIYKNYVLLSLKELSNNPIEFKVKVEAAKDWSEIQEAIDEEDFEISDLFDMMSDFISDIVK